MRRAKQGFTFIEIMVVLGIIGFVAAIALVNYLTARRDSQGYMCTANLAKIHGAKQQWGFDASAEETAVPAFNDILPYLNTQGAQQTVECPAAGAYTLNALNEAPTCSLATTEGRHNLSK